MLRKWVELAIFNISKFRRILFSKCGKCAFPNKQDKRLGVQALKWAPKVDHLNPSTCQMFKCGNTKIPQMLGMIRLVLTKALVLSPYDAMMV